MLLTNLEKVTSLLHKYRDSYNNIHLIEKILQNISLKNHSVVINNWSHVFANNGSGDCVDISYSLFRKLKDSNHKVFFCEGLEPKYFYDADYDNHAFLLLEIDEQEYIVDPSLQIITKLKDSNYILRTKLLNFELDRKPYRELKVYNVSDPKDINYKDIQTAVIGLNHTREYAISLGFVRLCNALHVLFLITYNRKKYFLVKDNYLFDLLGKKLDGLNRFEREINDLFIQFLAEGYIPNTK